MKNKSIFCPGTCSLVVKNPPASSGDMRCRFLSLGRVDPLEKGMATHSSICAWRIPWIEAPGGLQSQGLTKSNTTKVT